MMDPSKIPLTAWEQAVIIVLFVVLIIGVLLLISKVLNDQRKAQVSSQKELLQMQQNFIEKRDGQWQDFLSEQRCIDRDALKEYKGETNGKFDVLSNALAELTKTFSNFAQEVHEHIVDEDARFDVLLSDTQKARADHVKARK
jgi:hypothetical protein